MLAVVSMLGNFRTEDLRPQTHHFLFFSMYLYVPGPTHGHCG